MDRDYECVKEGGFELENLIFLQFFLPKNWSRAHPLDYLLVFAIFFVFLALFWLGLFKILLPIGLLILVLFGFFLYFSYYPLF
jgi:hypothetical protein